MSRGHNPGWAKYSHGVRQKLGVSDQEDLWALPYPEALWGLFAHEDLWAEYVLPARSNRKQAAGNQDRLAPKLVEKLSVVVSCLSGWATGPSRVIRQVSLRPMLAIHHPPVR